MSCLYLEQVVKERKLAERKAAARAGSKGGGQRGGQKGGEDAPARKNTGGVSTKKGISSTPPASSGRASLGIKGSGVMKGAVLIIGAEFESRCCAIAPLQPLQGIDALQLRRLTPMMLSEAFADIAHALAC